MDIMQEPRTAEQVEADNNLLLAVENCMKVYDLFQDGHVLGDFMVLTATNRLHNSGIIETKHPILFRDGDIPWYRALGLISIHEVNAKTMIVRGDDNG